MPMVIALACLGMRLTPAEAITAATINAAHAIAAAEEVGSLELGKAADMVVLDLPDYRHLPMHFGVNPVHTVVKRGQPAFRADRGVQRPT